MLRGSGPHLATRCGGRRGVHERVTARDEVAVMVTVIEVAPVPVTAGDVATVPVTAGDVERRAPAERPRRTLPKAEREGKGASTLCKAVSARAGGAEVECWRHGRAEIKWGAVHEVMH